MRSDHVALILRNQIPVGALVEIDIEVIEPEIGENFLELLIAVNSAEQLTFGKVARHDLLRTIRQLNAAAKLGRCGGAAGTGCQNNAATRSPTFATGNTVRIYAATYDYPMFEASPPGNTQQAPTINGGAATSNQADITTSASATITY